MVLGDSKWSSPCPSKFIPMGKSPNYALNRAIGWKHTCGGGGGRRRHRFVVVVNVVVSLYFKVSNIMLDEREK